MVKLIVSVFVIFAACLVAEGAALGEEERAMWRVVGESRAGAAARLGRAVAETAEGGLLPPQRACLGQRIGMAHRNVNMALGQAVVEMRRDEASGLSGAELENSLRQQLSARLEPVIQQQEALLRACGQ